MYPYYRYFCIYSGIFQSSKLKMLSEGPDLKPSLLSHVQPLKRPLPGLELRSNSKVSTQRRKMHLEGQELRQIWLNKRLPLRGPSLNSKLRLSLEPENKPLEDQEFKVNFSFRRQRKLLQKRGLEFRPKLQHRKS